MSDYITEFIDFLKSHGFTPNDPIKGDDRIDRIRVNNEKKKDLRYKLKISHDRAFGWFVYSKNGETVNFSSINKTTMTQAEREALNARIEAEKLANEQAREKEMLSIAEKARRLWKSYEAADPDHKYLKKKQIDALAIRQNGKRLVVPVYTEGQLWSLQYIDETGDKRFLSGGKTKGGYATLIFQNDDTAEIIICEGYATGVSIRMATGLPVVIAFNATNVPIVARYIRAKFPESRIIVAADNDLFTMRPELQKDHPDYKNHDGNDPIWAEWREKGMLVNAGIEAALLAAKNTGCEISVPEFEDKKEKPTDFNDYHVIHGLDRLNTKIRMTKPLDELMPCDRSGGEALGEGHNDKHLAPQTDSPPSYLFDNPPDHLYDDLYTEETREVRDLYDDKLPATKNNHLPMDEIIDGDWMERLTIGKNGPIGTSLKNIDLIIRYHKLFKDLFCYDEFAHQKILVSCPPWESIDTFKVRNMKDEDVTRLAIEMEKNVDIKPSLANLTKVLNSAIMKKRRHPAREYFSRLEWDGVERLKTWLAYYCGAEYDHPDYLSAVGTKWLTAAVARVFHGGVKFDHILIFEGAQSAGKSTMLRELATIRGCEYFLDDISVSKLGDDKEVPKMQGKLIIELAELSGMRKKDSDELKQAITTQKDTIVRKYENEPTTYPRQFVLAGTINPKNGYLIDSTGNRRFWPVLVSDHIDLEALKKDKEQLWAEAVHRYKNGETLYLPREIEKLAKKAQDERRVVDAWTSRVVKVINNSDKITDTIMDEIWTSLGFRMYQVGVRETDRMSSIFMSLGFERSRRRVSGEREDVWIKKKIETEVEEKGEEIEF